MSSDIVMITGAAGFIGSHLVEALLENDCEVHGFDLAALDQCQNLSAVRNHPNFHYTVGDIRSEADIDAFFQPNASKIYHLASVVGVHLYMQDPLSLIDIGIIGTRNLMERCIKHKVRMLFTSTSEIYGKNPSVPWNEDGDRVLGPTSVDRWCYSTSKAMIEHILIAAHRKYDWPLSIVRFFNVYGPRQNPIFIVSKSVYRVLRGEPLEIYDGGSQTRCFTYIDDIIEGVIAAGTHPDAVGEVFNLGNNVETTVKEVMDIITDASDAPVKLIDVDTGNRFGNVYEDIPRRVPDISKIKDKLGWQPNIMVKEGVIKTLDWARNNAWYLE